MITEEFEPVTDTVEEEASVEACTKCTACNTVCPVARSTEIFRGPKALGPDMERFRSPQEAAVTPGLDLCSGCKLCEVTCPSQVSIQEYIRRAQNQGARETGRTLRDWVLGRTRLLGKLGSMTATLANFGNSNPLFRVLMERFVGIHRRRPLPKYQWLTFERWFKRHPRPAKPRRKVAYFYGCWVNYNDLTPVVEEMDIVASSTSCGLMLKHDYDHLLEIAGAERVGAKTYDIMEYLWMLHEAGELNTNFQAVPLRLLYHAPCHLKSHGIGYPAIRLLRLIPGVKLEEVDEGCCGISGTFGVKVEKYDLSMKIGSRLFEAVKAAGSDQVLADCETCRMQVEHGAGATSAHPLEILARAYGHG